MLPHGHPTRIDDPDSAGIIRRRRWLHRGTFGVLVLVLAAAGLDGVDVLDAVGPDEDTVRASAEGYELVVEHPSVTRPALASVLHIRVFRSGGFDGPIDLAIARSYLEIWDVNGVLPAPASETSAGDWVIWRFDPPPGESLEVTYEARIEPGVQSRRTGVVAVVTDGAHPIVSVRFNTDVRP